MDNLFTNDLFDKKTKDRFWNQVCSRQAGECWVWDGSVSANGYGQFWYNQLNFSAHRISYMMFFGPIQSNDLVCHKCDNKRCVNPKHLYIGTHLSNIIDRYTRFPDSGRGYRVSNFNTDEASQMNTLYQQGWNYTNISELFNTTRQTISNIVNKRTTHLQEINNDY